MTPPTDSDPPLPAQAGCAVTRLTLTGFRNYTRLRLDVPPGSVVLTGPNGAGKTNLLEALSLLGPGRGLRGAALADFPHRAIARGPLGDEDLGDLDGEDEGGGSGVPWGVSATLLGPDGLPVDLATGVEAAGSRRQARIDARPVRGLAALSEHMPLVWLTPDMERLFHEGASGRRRFLDRLVLALDPEHAGRSAAYAHAMRERGRLLRDGLREDAWFAALEDSMARHGTALAAARREVAERLTQDLADHGGLGLAEDGSSREVADQPLFPRAALTVTGDLEDRLGSGPALAAEEWMRAALAEGRRDDGRTGSACVGPHRADIQVRHLPRNIGVEYASTGERKAVLIALLLSLARVMTRVRGRPPVVLLDEVAAHLDPERRRALAHVLKALRTQVWATGTDLQAFDSWEGFALFLRLEDGAVVG
ncbi:MAG: DNA replication/repair protein RecF [Rhodospirillaceae bacterium]